MARLRVERTKNNNSTSINSCKYTIKIRQARAKRTGERCTLFVNDHLIGAIIAQTHAPSLLGPSGQQMMGVAFWGLAYLLGPASDPEQVLIRARAS